MKQKSRFLLLIGVVCLGLGTYLYFKNNGDSVNQKNLDISRNATSAEDAARQISANNQGEIGGNSFAMLLLGIGGVLTVASIYNMTKKNIPA